MAEREVNGLTENLGRVLRLKCEHWLWKVWEGAWTWPKARMVAREGTYSSRGLQIWSQVMGPCLCPGISSKDSSALLTLPLSPWLLLLQRFCLDVAYVWKSPIILSIATFSCCLMTTPLPEACLIISAFFLWVAFVISSGNVCECHSHMFP